MSRSRRVSCLGRALGLAFGVIAALILIELAGRLVMGFAPLPGWAQDFNNRVGYELRPHEKYLYVSQSGEFENEVQNNARGLHDVEHPLAKPDGVYRILILADSYAQAREVPLAVNFARQLETLLNASAPDGVTFEVINAGHFGLGTTQEYLYYTTEGRRYDPDLVLLGFYVGNDVIDNHAPLIRAWNDIETVEFPYFSPDGHLHQPGLAVQRRVLSWLRQNVYLVNTLAGGPPPERVEVGDPNAITERALRVPMGVYQPPDATWQDAWAVTDHALGVLQTAVEQDGRTLAVFVIPDRRQIYDTEWAATLAKLPDLDPASLDRERPTRAALDLLAARHIPALSLLEPFRAADVRLYFEIDGHFNAAGHRLTAETLAAWLRAAGLIP
jgi:hypothetical protein